jgi:hypothetical protein
MIGFLGLHIHKISKSKSLDSVGFDMDSKYKTSIDGVMACFTSLRPCISTKYVEIPWAFKENLLIGHGCLDIDK